MNLQTVLAAIMLFWSSLYMVDLWLRSSARFAITYLSTMDLLGLSVHAAQARWYTTRFNRSFLRLSQWRPRLWRFWFGAGALSGVFLGLIATIVLSRVLIDGVNGILSQHFFAESTPTFAAKATSQSPPLLTPVLPGVNLPADQIGYYLLTLFFCGVVHELGHAVAANACSVRVNGVGVFITLFYPGAFVDMNSESLQIVSAFRQLKIYCAGVWHNIVVVVLALGYLYMGSFLLSPLYASGDGAVVSGVAPLSVLSGPRGLHKGDVVTKLSDCIVTSSSDWRHCLLNQTRLPANEVPGYCVPVGFIAQHQFQVRPVFHEASNSTSSLSECCDSNHTIKDLCFLYRAKESPGSSLSSYFACLPARSVSERLSCRTNADCAVGRRFKDVAKNVCVFPSIDNRTRLLRVVRPPHSPILFLGNPLELRVGVSVVDMRPRFSLIPMDAPEVLELCCKYLASLSGALALLNVVPCYALDGQYIFAAVVDLVFPAARFSRTFRDALYYFGILGGTFIIFGNVLLAFYNLS